MLKPVKDWDKIEGIEMGEYEVLKLGGHKVVIKNAYKYVNPTTKSESLKIEVDIDGGDKQAGFFQRQFDSDTRQDKKWPNGACKYISLKEEENCIKMFKGFITAVENSNPNFKWDWNEKSLIGKHLCGVFGQEEYMSSKGEVKLSTKLIHFRSLDKLPEVKIPKVKLLNDAGYIDVEEYEVYKQNQKNGNIEIKGDELDKFIDENLLD